MRKRICEMLKKYKEPILYLFFGVLTTLINWLVYTMAMLLLRQKIEVANGIAWLAAILFAYITNRLFVFKSGRNTVSGKVKEFLMFLGSRIVTGIVEIVGVPALYYMGFKQSVLGIDGFAAKAVVSIVVIVLNYIFSKLLVFKK